MAYATQMAAARQGILTPQMQQVLETERITECDLMERMAKGTIALPANHNHKNLVGKGIGAGLSTKINVNLGVSEDCCNVEKGVGQGAACGRAQGGCHYGSEHLWGYPGLPAAGGGSQPGNDRNGAGV